MHCLSQASGQTLRAWGGAGAGEGVIPRGQGITRSQLILEHLRPAVSGTWNCYLRRGLWSFPPQRQALLLKNPCIQFLKILLIHSWFFSLPLMEVIDLTNLLWLWDCGRDLVNPDFKSRVEPAALHFSSCVQETINSHGTLLFLFASAGSLKGSGLL